MKTNILPYLLIIFMFCVNEVTVLERFVYILPLVKILNFVS